MDEAACQPSTQLAAWLGNVPSMRAELHFDGRIVRCFTERPRSTFDLLAEAVRSHPNDEAIVFGGERLTYSRFAQLVDGWTRRLTQLGVVRGDRVAMLLGNGLAFPAVFFATQKLGAITVPINVREQTPGLAYMLSHCGAKVLVYESDLAERLPDTLATPHLKHRIALSPDALHGELDQPEIEIDGRIATPPPQEVEEEDTAAILYTSGTTGRPKGAMLTHLGICHSAMHYECCMGLTSGDRSVVAVPMSHVTGIVALIAGITRVAGTLIVMRSFKAAEFIALAERERMTHTLLVPAMYNLCLLEPKFAHADLSAWRLGGYGGAPMATATITRLAEQLPGLQLMNAYGATETTSPATLMPPSETAARPDSVGKAVPCGEVLVMDENGREVPHGVMGEIWLRGPMVIKGYWNDPEATAQNLTSGFWRSGDIGSVDEQGYVRVFDRNKDVINRGGYKIYSIEVENILMDHPDVIEAAVIAKACPVLGERGHAIVCVKDKHVVAETLARHCADRLADYKVPDSFSFRDAPLPRNANGKVMKRELRSELPVA
jgi:acyl-CoA synthetase (AMP-forming)/AMP-acid ligase II